MELYMHGPVGRQKCRYCDFASWAGREAWMPAYVTAMLQEAAHARKALGPQPISTVFLGGGTPSVLPAEELRRLLRGVMEQFPLEPGAEFTSEANPGTLTEAWLDTAVSLGVNRLSLGMQAAPVSYTHLDVYKRQPWWALRPRRACSPCTSGCPRRTRWPRPRPVRC